MRAESGAMEHPSAARSDATDPNNPPGSVVFRRFSLLEWERAYLSQLARPDCDHHQAIKPEGDPGAGRELAGEGSDQPLIDR